MTEKELYKAYADATNVSEKVGTENVKVLIDLIVSEAMATGKCTFGKIGTFESKDVAAVPAKKDVKNALTGGTYDVDAKPARKKIGFKLSKFGKTLGA